MSFLHGSAPEESDKLVFTRGEASNISSRIRTEYPDAKDIWEKPLVRFEDILLNGGSEEVQISASQELIEVYKRLGQMREMFNGRIGELYAKIKVAEADINDPYLASRTVAAIKRCHGDLYRITADIKTASIGGAVWMEIGSRLSKLEHDWGQLSLTAIAFDLRHGPEYAAVTEEQILAQMVELIRQAALRIGDKKTAEDKLGKAWDYYRDAERGWEGRSITKGDIIQDKTGLINEIKKVAP